MILYSPRKKWMRPWTIIGLTCVIHCLTMAIRIALIYHPHYHGMGSEHMKAQQEVKNESYIE